MAFDAALFHRHLANKRNNLKALEGPIECPFVPALTAPPVDQGTLHALNVKSSNWQIDGTHMHLQGREGSIGEFAEAEGTAPRLEIFIKLFMVAILWLRYNCCQFPREQTCA